MVKNKLDDLQIKNILSKMKIIGLVGASDNPEKPSNIVMRYLQTKSRFPAVRLSRENHRKWPLSEKPGKRQD